MNNRQRRIAVASAVAVIAAAAVLLMQRNRRRRRSVWTRPWIERRDSGRGTLYMVQEELLLEDRAAFRNFLRMTEEQFETVLNVTRRDYEKVDTLMRGAISADKRLALTLRFLATGESFRSLMYSTRIHETTIGRIIPEVCSSITTTTFQGPVGWWRMPSVFLAIGFVSS
ncbi:uncharacterized protein LOC124162701 [Ischnura elegans]|uniref:uncharacterized protein LOC124162701 n=1 Tax=Ischnura elegans TaxID=197161 RepID=UPI001ED8A0A1|nr:uncharacterized protein LOC124162701 [Ischnura elegans]